MGTAGRLVRNYTTTTILNRITGLIVILFGLNFLGIDLVK